MAQETGKPGMGWAEARVLSSTPRPRSVYYLTEGLPAIALGIWQLDTLSCLALIWEYGPR